MNIKHYLSFFAVSLLLSVAACTSEDEQIGPNIPEPGTDDPSRREVLLTLKNKLQSKPTTTKADGELIATDEENYIRSLDVYVFGSKEEQGTYTFQELHYYRDDATPVVLPGDVKSYPFGLTYDKENSNALLKLNKGLFVKLYIVANRTELYHVDDAGQVVKFEGFKSLVQDKPGQAENVVIHGVPELTEFVKFHTQLITPKPETSTADDILNTPLPMAGASTTPLDLTDFGTSSRTQISFRLYRMVARFNIVNDANKSKFTITDISMGNGRRGASFFPIVALPTNDATDLISYPARPVSKATQQTPSENDPTLTDITKGAFYTWPSPKDDEGYLILKGDYKVNQTETKKVSYKVPFQQLVDGVGSYIEVAYNHRYTIAITKADDYHLDFSLIVEDWDDAESDLEYNPDNDFDEETNIVLDDTGNKNAYVLENGNVELLPIDGSKLAFKMGSNTVLKEEIVYKAGSAKWLVADPDRVATKATSMNSLYTYVVDKNAVSDITKLFPVTIRLTNPASGTCKEIKVKVPSGPKISLMEVADNFNVFDPVTHIATIYNLAGQSIKLRAIADERTVDGLVQSGSSVKIDDTWLTSAVDDPLVASDYTLTLDAAQADASPTTTVNFESVATTVVTPVTVKLKDPKMTALSAKDFNTGTNNPAVDMTGSEPKVTLNGVLNNSFTLTVTSPEGVTTAVATGAWLTVTQSPGSKQTNGLKTTVITGKITNAADMGTTPKTDGKITIANKLDATETYVVSVETKLPAATEPEMKLVDGNLSTYDAESHTATLYNVVDQNITFTTSEPTKVASSKSWLTTTSTADAFKTEHTFTVATSGTEENHTDVVTFTNEAGRELKVSVTLADPSITPLQNEDFVSTGTPDCTFEIAGAPAVYTVNMPEATAATAFTLTVKSRGSIAVSANTASWLTAKVTNEEIVTDGKEATVTVAITEGTNLTEVQSGDLLLTNLIDGDELSVSVTTTVATPPIVPDPVQ